MIPAEQRVQLLRACENGEGISSAAARFWICEQIRDARAVWHFWQWRQI